MDNYEMNWNYMYYFLWSPLPLQHISPIFSWDKNPNHLFNSVWFHFFVLVLKLSFSLYQVGVCCQRYTKNFRKHYNLDLIPISPYLMCWIMALLHPKCLLTVKIQYYSSSLVHNAGFWDWRGEGKLFNSHHEESSLVPGCKNTLYTHLTMIKASPFQGLG